jgi:hypothetical protein
VIVGAEGEDITRFCTIVRRSESLLTALDDPYLTSIGMNTGPFHNRLQTSARLFLCALSLSLQTLPEP